MALKIDEHPQWIYTKYSSVRYNYWLERFDTQLNKPTNQTLIKVLKVIRPPSQEVSLNFKKVNN